MKSVKIKKNLTTTKKRITNATVVRKSTNYSMFKLCNFCLKLYFYLVSIIIFDNVYGYFRFGYFPFAYMSFNLHSCCISEDFEEREVH